MSKAELAARTRWLIAAAVGFVTAMLVVVTGGLTSAVAAVVYSYDDVPSAYDDVANLALDVVDGTTRSVQRVRPQSGAAEAHFGGSGVFSAPKGALDDAVGAFCSFTGTTAVLMADGTTKALSEIEVGDWVLAEDPETGERGRREVTHVWIHHDTVADLVVDGEAVTTTEDHPFWNATDHAWQRADALDAGDRLLTADGTTVIVAGLDPRTTTTTTAYNLTVEGVHTYFVVAGDDEILVHNTCDIPGHPFRGGNAPQRAFDHLELNHGLDPHVASNRLHAIKQHFGIGAADDVVIGRTGDVYNAQTGDWLGMLTDSGWGR